MSIHSSREFVALVPIGHNDAVARSGMPRAISQTARYAKDQHIFDQGERAGKIFRVQSGSVRLYHLLADGRRQISAFCLPGEVFGFAQQGTHELYAEAIEDTALEAQSLQETLTEENLHAVLANFFSAQTHLLVLGRQLACERLASFLLDMNRRLGAGNRVKLAMSRNDIADYLGLTVETVSRGLSRLQKDGLIRLHDARSIEMMKPHALVGMVE